ncbi:heavy metal-associated isoprenylated plant protein 3 [Argentina anserina]|uniref:heavy metal-associated isoprenylated plant protein 3 n=1 Tax=Argentina anserina TaxID=57926 RepID=UPI00217627C1|nr:heavy metal-associated isoprenylated plant protein 3 [Potentilla anserina]
MGAKKNAGGGDDKKGGDGAEQKKKEDNNPITVVLKIDMHCDGCTSKIVKTIKAFDGVDSVKPETGAHKLTVVGKVDPSKLREKLAGKLKKKVDLISPQPKKEKEKENSKEDNSNKKQPEKAAVKDDKKPKEPPVTTAVFKLNTHCQGCIDKIYKTVTKTKGFHDINIDKEKELVTVKGTMDMKAVAESLKVRLKRNVEIVPPKKDKDNKEKGEGGENGGGGKKKNKEEGGGEGGNAGGGGGGGGKLDKMDFPAGQPGFGQVPPYGVVYGYDYPPPMIYMGNQLHAPQIFSDENPNACSIM